MWIGDVDVPEDLIQAARSGRLVLFVGAGASVDPPSSLPLFRGLTEVIATEAHYEYTPNELDQPDILLGRVKAANVDVHQRVRALIGDPNSRPNALHEAIVELASATGHPRVVTTNYDTHLSGVVKARGLKWSEYVAPALPMGNDFEGLVYLHGGLMQASGSLIVTDADFGRAYLRDAWAARFLERMFASFTVLFIGYSHSDVVMHYLGRSLGPDSSRYVFTHELDAPRWRQLEIRAVGYDVQGGSHAALTGAIAGWSRLLTMKLLDHRQEIGKLVGARPSSIPAEQSYLEWVISDERRVSLFTELAGGEDWLLWACAQQESQPLFDPSVPARSTTAALAMWFARLCQSNEDLSKVGLRVVSDKGARMSATLWNAFGQQLMARRAPRPAWLGHWFALMVENAPPGYRDWLEYALGACTFPADRHVALLLLDHLTEPHLVPRPTFGLSDSPRFDVELRADGYWIRDAWEKILRPNLTSIALDVVAIAERQLRRAHLLLMVSGSASPGWDPVSAGRSSIATHEQDHYGNELGIVIDTAREALDSLEASNASLATAVVDRWTASDVPLLRRLALHAVAMDTRRTGTEKVKWLLDLGWLFDVQLKHEVFELLETALPTTDGATVDLLVATAAPGPQKTEDDDIRQYEAFNALGWIAKYSTAESASVAFNKAQTEHPNFGVREHPDFNMWMGGVRIGSTPPMPIEEFHTLLERDRSEALLKLNDFKRTGFAIDEPTWEDAVSLVRSVVQEHPEDGLILLQSTSDLEKDLIGAVTSGWARTKLNNETALSALELLSALDVGEWADELAWLLASHGDPDTRTEWHRFAAARELARAIGQNEYGTLSDTDEFDWLQKALNSRGGMLAQFWMRVISQEWTDNQPDWKGIPANILDPIEELLAGGGIHSALTEVILASQLHFLFAADRAWCESRVLPLLGWADPLRARRAWEGFLYWGRWNDELLEVGLRDHYLAAVSHFSEFSEELGRQLGEHLASIALYSEHDPNSWLDQFTRSAPLELRVEWINRVAWLLDRLDPAVLDEQWKRWMRGYWKRRLESVPVELTFEEASALAGWAVKLNNNIDEAVELALSARAGLSEHRSILHELNEHADRAPGAYGLLIAHLLTNTDLPFWECYWLSKVFDVIRDSAASTELGLIREHAVRLGCIGADAW